MSSGHSPPPAFQGHPSRSSSLGVAALGWESATSWVLGSREVRDRETDSRGCGLTDTPGRHPYGPCGSQHTGSLVALCAHPGAHWHPRGRGGHRSESPVVAPSLLVRVAPLGVALREEGEI